MILVSSPGSSSSTIKLLAPKRWTMALAVAGPTPLTTPEAR